MELHNVDAFNELNESSFEPLSRLRANTWPVKHREHTTPREEVKNETPENATEYQVTSSKESDPSSVGKRSYFRRNAWGSMSYSDLITKAIENSPEQRLTLSQIYDWVVQNVPYFNDKGDSNSSAGWKNSIRHNLSLHNRFMRVQNEGAGKSSWWLVNHDAKLGQNPRRRAASMDPNVMSRKRGRAKKHVEQLRTGSFENFYENSASGSEYSSASDLSSITGDSFAAGLFVTRARAGSNASSFGHLSPIEASIEPDINDDGYGSNWNVCPNQLLMPGADSVSKHLADLLVSNALKVPENILIGNAFDDTPTANQPIYSNCHLTVGVQPAQETGLSPTLNASQQRMKDMYNNTSAVNSTALGLTLRDLLSDAKTPLVPNLNNSKSILLNNVCVPSVHCSGQQQQLTVNKGIAAAVLQQQLPQRCSPQHCTTQTQLLLTLQLQQQQPVSPVSCLHHLLINHHLASSKYVGSNVTHCAKLDSISSIGTCSTADQQPLAQSALPLPVDLDFSLQELQAGGLECDMDRILHEGNFDLDF